MVDMVLWQGAKNAGFKVEMSYSVEISGMMIIIIRLFMLMAARIIFKGLLKICKIEP